MTARSAPFSFSFSGRSFATKDSNKKRAKKKINNRV